MLAIENTEKDILLSPPSLSLEHEQANRVRKKNYQLTQLLKNIPLTLKTYPGLLGT